MSSYVETLKKYEQLNTKANSQGIVFFGTDWLKKFPICELAKSSNIDTNIYNRSLNGLTIDDVETVVDTCIYALHPSKVFITIGENDITKDNFDYTEFSEKFEWLLYSIHSNCKCSIYILSNFNSNDFQLNNILKCIAKKYNCGYIDTTCHTDSFIALFSKLCYLLRERPISFFEAMTTQN